MLRSLLAMYNPWRYANTLLTMLKEADGSARRYLKTYWSTQDFSKIETDNDGLNNNLRTVLLTGMVFQILLGLLLILLWKTSGLVAGELFGLALLVSYPLVWAHMLALAVGGRTAIYLLANPKKLGRAIVCDKLESQVNRLRRKHDFKVVAVAGSVGKTSTKLAIANVLGQDLRVRHQTGNYNDRVTVPLIFFAQNEPNIMNIFAWFKIFRANERAIQKTYPYDVVVVELGTDGPGFMREFSYLNVDVAVITAVTPEHMEFFGTMDAVAKEELTIFQFAKQVLVSSDDIPEEYLSGREYVTYSLLDPKANYHAKVILDKLEGQELEISLPDKRLLKTSSKYIGVPGAKFTLAAAAVADQLGMKLPQIGKAIKSLQPFAGRMQVLKGIGDTTLIDDTYNASPVAVMAALDVLYAAPTKQRIAILGGMNELGDYSQKAHQEVGAYCDPKKLACVVTIGHDANKWLASAAKKRGCKVMTFTSPYEAGDFVQTELKKGAVVLAKGSQNGVFAEEALKPLLLEKSDEPKLVRQSGYWLKEKHKQFNG